MIRATKSALRVGSVTHWTLANTLEPVHSVPVPIRVSRDATSAPPPTTDEALMLSFCAGDEHAFEVLFDRHATAVRRLIIRMCGNRVLAADVTQTTFLSVVGGRGRFVEGSRFKPWLYAIAMNALRDHFRRTKREVLREADALPEGSYEMTPRDLGLERQVQHALDLLPADQREAVVLHQLEGFSFKEISEMLGVKQSAIKVRAHRGYERLRPLLKGAWTGHE